MTYKPDFLLYPNLPHQIQRQKASVMRAFRHTDSCKPFDEKNFYIKSRTTENKFKLPPTSYKTAVTDPYTSLYLTHKTCNIDKE